MAEILGIETGVSMPSSLFGSSSLILLLTLFFVIILLCLIAYLVWNYRVFKYKIIIFENIAGQGYQVTGRDKARLLRVGDGGEEVLFLKKRKKFFTAYGRKMGKNTYWFAYAQDGYPYNILLGDLDTKMGMLDIEPTDREMRYASVSIRRNIQDRYKKKGFMEQYGTLVFNGLIMLMFIFGTWFLLDKMSSIAGNVNNGVVASQKVVEASTRLVESLEKICTGGNLVPAS